MRKSIVGIDPGKSGWIVALDCEDGTLLWDCPMPETARELVQELRSHAAPVFVAIERQHAMPGQGVSSMFSLGVNVGIIEGVVAALGLAYGWIRANDWQQALLRGEKKAASRKERMKAYVAVAERLWPTESFKGLRGGLHDGKAAAALIAEYTRRQLPFAKEG